MAVRSIWSGFISTEGIGLPLTVPVKLSAAAVAQDIRFRSLHNKCRTPVQEIVRCPSCETTVDRSTETVKGFPLGKDSYLPLEPQELEGLPVKSTSEIVLLGFVKPDRVSPVLVEKSYYLGPQEDKLLPKAFLLLLQAMEQAGVVGVGKLTMRQREHLVALRPYMGVFLVQTLFYADEVRSVQEMAPTRADKVAISDKERQLMAQLIGKHAAGAFEHGSYQDHYRTALTGVIEAKLEGKAIAPVQAPKALPTPADNLETLLAEAVGTPTAKAQERPKPARNGKRQAKAAA